MNKEDFKLAEKYFNQLSRLESRSKTLSELGEQVKTWERDEVMQLKIGNHNTNTNVSIDNKLATEIIDKQLRLVNNLIERKQKQIDKL